MKKIAVLLSSVLSLMFVNAQESEPTSVADWSPKIYQVNKMYPGYVITNDNDTVQGFIKAGTRCATGGVGNSNQNMCEFYKNENDKKPLAKYKPDDIKGYKIADKVYESIAYSGGLMKKSNFNLMVADGKIRLYEWYSTKDGFVSMTRQSGESDKDYDARRYNTDIVIAKDGKEPIVHSSLMLKFADKMSALVAEHKELANKVKNKEKGYKMLNLFEIINEYNAWAAENL